MSAGANFVGSIVWDLRDRDALHARASKVALGKARLIANEMASGLNAKLGALVYASNTAPIREEGVVGGTPGGEVGGIIIGGIEPEKRIRLFPEKVTERTTVYAVFAIE